MIELAIDAIMKTYEKGINHYGGLDWEEDREILYEQFYYLTPHLEQYDTK